ncbi:hypothetical protein CP08DC60_0403A, partial [Chlamydia psittaci 08DC60]
MLVFNLELFCLSSFTWSSISSGTCSIAVL